MPIRVMPLQCGHDLTDSSGGRAQLSERVVQPRRRRAGGRRSCRACTAFQARRRLDEDRQLWRQPLRHLPVAVDVDVCNGRGRWAGKRVERSIARLELERSHDESVHQWKRRTAARRDGRSRSTRARVRGRVKSRRRMRDMDRPGLEMGSERDGGGCRGERAGRGRHGPRQSRERLVLRRARLQRRERVLVPRRRKRWSSMAGTQSESRHRIRQVVRPMRRRARPVVSRWRLWRRPWLWLPHQLCCRTLHLPLP